MKWNRIETYNVDSLYLYYTPKDDFLLKPTIYTLREKNYLKSYGLLFEILLVR